MADSPTSPYASLAAGLSPGAGNLTGRQSTLSEWAGPYVTSMLGKAQALTESPYQVYGGPLTAGVSPLQQQYFGGIGALGFPSRLGQSFTQPGVMQSYISPYMQTVLAPQLQAMQRQADIQRQNIGAQTARAGAFGGARAGLMNAALNADLMRQQQQAVGQAYGQAYTQGLGQFNVEQQQAAQLANMLAGAGAQQRAIEAEGIAADLGEFQQQRDYPYKQLQFQQSMLQGMPIQSIAASYQQPTSLANAINTMGGLAGLYEKLYPKA